MSQVRATSLTPQARHFDRHLCAFCTSTVHRQRVIAPEDLFGDALLSVFVATEGWRAVALERDRNQHPKLKSGGTFWLVSIERLKDPTLRLEDQQ